MALLLAIAQRPEAGRLPRLAIAGGLYEPARPPRRAERGDARALRERPRIGLRIWPQRTARRCADARDQSADPPGDGRRSRWTLDGSGLYQPMPRDNGGNRYRLLRGRSLWRALRHARPLQDRPSAGPPRSRRDRPA